MSQVIADAMLVRNPFIDLSNFPKDNDPSQKMIDIWPWEVFKSLGQYQELCTDIYKCVDMEEECAKPYLL